MFFIAGAIFVYMLFFADSGERWFARAMLMGSVVALITATMQDAAGWATGSSDSDDA